VSELHALGRPGSAIDKVKVVRRPAGFRRSYLWCPLSIYAHKNQSSALDCNQRSLPLLFESEIPLYKHGLQKIVAGITTSLNIPSSTKSDATSDCSTLDSDGSIQSSQYSRTSHQPLRLDERYTNLAAWNSVRPIDNKQHNDIPQCVRNRTNINAWKSTFYGKDAQRKQK
jgi:hypothetical protein